MGSGGCLRMMGDGAGCASTGSAYASWTGPRASTSTPCCEAGCSSARRGAAPKSTAPLRAEEQPASQQGVEVLARGPVHEAYAEPVDAQPAPSPIIRKQPPDPIAELPPDQKPEGDNVQWLPGYWAWDDDRSDYIWVSGFWRQPPPGRQWVP